MRDDETTLHSGVHRVVLVSYIPFVPVRSGVRARECSSMLVIDSLKCKSKNLRNFRMPEPRAVSMAVVKTSSGAVVVLR